MTKIDINKNTELWFGRFKGTKIKDLPTWYSKWLNIIGFSGDKRYLEK